MEGWRQDDNCAKRAREFLPTKATNQHDRSRLRSQSEGETIVSWRSIASNGHSTAAATELYDRKGTKEDRSNG